MRERAEKQRDEEGMMSFYSISHPMGGRTQEFGGVVKEE
jgi:hypothetical protein